MWFELISAVKSTGLREGDKYAQRACGKGANHDKTTVCHNKHPLLRIKPVRQTESLLSSDHLHLDRPPCVKQQKPPL